MAAYIYRDVNNCTDDWNLEKTYPLSLTNDPLSRCNKGAGVSALSNAWGWQLTAPLPLIRRLSTQNRSRPEASSTARYSSDVKWSQSESRANWAFFSAFCIAAMLALVLSAMSPKGEGWLDGGLERVA